MSKLKYYDGTNWEVVNGQILGDTLPIGAIVPYGSATAPTNWLVCDGSAVSRTTYAELFAVIGTSFGAGDGSTTFNLPNLKGKVAVGIDSTQTEFDTIGETGGEKTHTLTIAEMPVHNHELAITGGTETGARFSYEYASGKRYYGGQDLIQNAGNGAAHNNLQPYQVVCYIIKAKQSAGLVANVSNTQSDSTTDTYSCNYLNGTTLYSGSSAGNITLSDSAANYSAIEIFYKSSDGIYGNTGKIYSPNNKNVGLSAPYNISTTCYNKYGVATISGTAISIANQIETQLWTSVQINTGNYFTIEKVIGYK